MKHLNDTFSCWRSLRAVSTCLCMLYFTLNAMSRVQDSTSLDDTHIGLAAV